MSINKYLDADRELRWKVAYPEGPKIFLPSAEFPDGELVILHRFSTDPTLEEFIALKPSQHWVRSRWGKR